MELNDTDPCPGTLAVMVNGLASIVKPTLTENSAVVAPAGIVNEAGTAINELFDDKLTTI